MATKETGGPSVSGGASTAVGKGCRVKQEGRQRKLVTEEKDKGKEVGKRVTFRLEEDKSDVEGKKLFEEIRKEVGVQMERELEELRKEKERYKEYFKELEEKEKVLENKLEALEDKFNEKFNDLEAWIKEKLGNLEKGNVMDSGGTGDESCSDMPEVRSVSGRGRNSLYASTGSVVTLGSEGGLSNREVDKIRKWVKEKEKDERKCNVVLKGISIPNDIVRDVKKGTEWLQEFLKAKVGVEGKVMSYRLSGPVTIVRLEEEEVKREIMRNNYKLKGEKFFY